jgi:hypothetical protein
MAKKDKLVFQYTPDLEQIDKELAEAMDALDDNVKQVDGVLREFAPAHQTETAVAPVEAPPVEAAPAEQGSQAQ